MKTTIKACAIVALFGAVLWGGCLVHNNTIASLAPGALPQDVMQTCTLSQQSFNKWFVSGKPTENGAVSPANSVAFPHNDNCDFYQWSEQMFLWLLSPSTGLYGGNGPVLSSQIFYDVSPPDNNGRRKLIPHVPTNPIIMDSHLLKDGPDRLPVVKDSKGRLVEVENMTTVSKEKALLVSSEAGSVVVDHVSANSNGGFTFFDKAGKAIAHPKALITIRSSHMPVVHQFAAGKKFVLLDANGNVTESEEGQATGDVLRAQNGSLVYYVTMVNDVYATYLKATQNGQISNATFPITAGARDSLCKIARASGKILTDSNALAMELKTSWVEASSLKDPQNYITINAVIPTYDTTNNKKWVPNGKKTTKMALIGMHIVGSAAGHPEMIWATFEHKKNTPNAAYQYVDSTSKVRTVPQDGGTGWLLTANAADTTNQSHATVFDPQGNASDTLYGNNGFAITPSNTQRSMPWGSAKGKVTNQQDKSSAASNSEIISINNSILKMLVGNDIRKNYLFIGATWTQGGAGPTGNVYSSSDTTHGVAIGTNVLANSTMETYLQTDSTTCFSCHSASNSLSPDSLSHVFGAITFKNLTKIKIK